MVTASAAAEAAAWNILVVEDDAPVRESLRLVLETSGYNVSTAATGEEALSLINKNSYDIVL
ncbi:MAG: response regulator, partial [bacterium]